MSKIFENLKRERKRAKLTQKSVADALGITRQAYSFYETGRTIPSIDVINDLCDIFGCGLAAILEKGDKIGDMNILELDPSDNGRIPILGRIPAGVPITAMEDIRGYVDVPREWQQNYGALEVVGDSMSPKYLPGDIVIFKVQGDCESGQDCIVYVNGFDATMKKVIKKDGGIMLQPLNSKYDPKYFTKQDDIKILGIIVQIRRSV